MRVKWFEIEAGSTIPYEGGKEREQINIKLSTLEYSNLIYENLAVFTPNLRDPDAKWIFPGTHEYTFKYKLAKELPYSLDAG